MFDILCSVWKKAGAGHSPILPLDISRLTAENAVSEISRLHKCGLDSVYLFSRLDLIDTTVVESVFSAAAKRYMLVFVDETLIASAFSCSDGAFREYNPMLCAHTVRLSKSSETVLSPLEEICESLWLKENDGVFTDALREAPDEDVNYEKYHLVLTPAENGADVLSPEFGDMLIVGAYESFYESFGEKYKGTLAGVVSNRLADCTLINKLWSYDMTEEFFALGGKPIELVSVFADTDRRSRKEGERIYSKTLAARLDKVYLDPVSKWCGKKSLAFAGTVPYEFAATASRRFTLPIYNDELFKVHERDGKDKLLAVRAMSDTARSEGFTGCIYRAVSVDAAGLVKESAEVASAGASLVMLDEKFGVCEHTDSVCLRPEDMKRLMYRLRRFSTLGTSCKPDVSCAVLYDDGFIPFAGAKKLSGLGYQFNFLPVSQAMERGHSREGEFLVDKFVYNAVLIDPRVRLDVPHIKHIGEFAVHGGMMFRGGTFADFAKKHLEVTEEMRENAKSFLSYSTYKSGILFRYFVNTSNVTTHILLSDLPEGAVYRFDSVTGDKTSLQVIDEKLDLRVLPGEDIVLVHNTAETGLEVKSADKLSEVHALKNGENTVNIRFGEGKRGTVELDSLNGHFADLVVNGKSLERIVADPLRVDVTSMLCDGVNTFTITSDGKVSGAVLRISE
ncbi:MAG: hypothetical protein IKM46_00190 [Clostridia bacterium]|nr:hypothetical protein [Clostridia bacterium]